ncbi:putative esophageal gland cell secretory protein 2, partial [Meloidogyne graminicola]
DCSWENENHYKCEDKSKYCKEWGKFCENVFLHKCVRKACPKECKVCHSSNEDPKIPIITTTTQSIQNSTVGMTTKNILQTTNNQILTTNEYTETTTTINDYNNDIELTTEEIESSTSTTTMLLKNTTISYLIMLTTPIEEITDEEFKDAKKMKCKSCNAKRKKLNEIYDKYYPK